MRGSRFSTNLLREVWVAMAALCLILTVSSTGFHLISIGTQHDLARLQSFLQPAN